jgi:hypothetical protein
VSKTPDHKEAVRRFLGIVVGLFLVSFVTSACGQLDGSSSTNGGIVPISQSGTYNYTVTITPPSPPPCPTNDGTIQIPCLQEPIDCTGLTLALTSGDTTENLNTSGSLYFAAGNWTGTLQGGGSPECQWTVTLTPS